MDELHLSARLRVATILIAAVAIVATVARSYQRSTEMQKMVTTGVATSADGTRIAYSKVGQGPALVLVDGAFCYRENGPSPDLAPLLAPHFTVYAYDRRGRGESGDTGPYATLREVEDLRAVIAAAGDSAFVFGVSSGAALAMHAAAAGAPIRKLALYEPPLGAAGTGPDIDAGRRRLEALVASDDRAGAVRYFMGEVFGAPRFFVALMPMLMPNAWRRNKGVAHTLPYDFTILGDRSILGVRASAVAVPTLVLSGEKSPAFLRDAAANVARALPDARVLLLPDQSHDVSAAGAALVPVLREFYADEPVASLASSDRRPARHGAAQ